ncbi:MAG: hypothetical protein A2142_06475 [candidate division Zixibacteria bacterium RBG_16_48_11]|nr:MAG: hypothetical protein A2142_06475 [candidate division Zixibacteria bacterium RBG_16_48_11]
MLRIWAGKLPLLLAVITLGGGCQSQNKVSFDGDRAYQYLLTQCDFGPRHPGSDGHQKMLEFLKSELEKHSDKVKLQNFKAENPASSDSLNLTNVLVSFYPEMERRVLLCAHWDTRPWADRDSDSSKHNLPIIGANDGASGVAVLLHLAELIARHKPQYGVDLVFFDGEDLGQEGRPETYALGSQYFAKASTGYRPEFAILLDMVGDKDLKIYPEEYSARYAPHTVGLIWSKAKELKLDCLVDSVGPAVYDDHVPLLQAGIPCANLIDFVYPYWHTTRDTPDKCSARSLENVGRLVAALLYD